jgi:uncharacterized protein DUF397
LLGGVVGSSIDELAWRHGRQCDGGACVELAPLDEAILVRSSKAADVVVALSPDEWLAFCADVKAGLFDGL